MRRPSSRAPNCRGSQTRKAKGRRPQLERLEKRDLLASLPVEAGDGLLSGQAGVYSCPICTGVGLSGFVQQMEETDPVGSSGDSGGSLPEAALPVLSSRPNATAKLFLDFNGNVQGSWGEFLNVSTPAYDFDGNTASFSTAERNTITQIWRRVSEDYAPFNIDVTTIDPGSRANKVVAHIAIGGDWSDWFGSEAGGVAYIGGFYNSAPNVGYVFEDALGNGHAKYTAEAISHEAGHLFGLLHQARWSGSTLIESYHSGNANWAPIMGVGYDSSRTTWHNGPTSEGPSDLQDDLAIITNASNDFGYAADDHGGSIAAASNLSINGTAASAVGLVGRNNDLDFFSFNTGGGTVSFTLAVDLYGPNLDAVLELRNSAGTILATAAPGASFGATLSHVVGAGTFYLVARGMGDYGDMGRYTITATVPIVPPAPEVALQVIGETVADGGSVDFGQTAVGTPVTRTFSVTNTGNGPLTLTELEPASLPAGFTLVANLGSTTLAPGESTTFAIRFDAESAGTFGGPIALVNDDANENPYDLVLSATAADGPVPAPEITVLDDTTDLTSGQTIDFGTTSWGTAVTRTITVRNDGDGTLTLASIQPGSLPAGFSLVTNLGSTSLAPGASTTFTVRMNATAAGSPEGTLALASDDGDEDHFELLLTGTVNAPVKQIIDDGAAGNVLTGGWTLKTGQGFVGDIHTAAKGTGSKQATWKFTGLPSGQYNVWATWRANGSNATNAPFSFYNGSGSLPVLRVNQQLAPTAAADGAKWRFLRTITVNNGWAMVKLTNSSNGTVVADAIRLVQVAATAPASAPVLAHATLPATAASSFLVYASAGKTGSGTSADHSSHDELPAFPLPKPWAAADRPASSNAPTAHDLVWSRDEDVRPESALLDDAASLLSSLRESPKDDATALALDQLLASA